MHIVDLLAAAGAGGAAEQVRLRRSARTGRLHRLCHRRHPRHHVVRLVLHPVHQVVRTVEAACARAANCAAASGRPPRSSEGAAKLEKNSAWRQIVDDGLARPKTQHAKMTDSDSKPMTGCTVRWPVRKPRSTPASLRACRSSPPSARPRRSSVCSVPSSASTAR
jgi:hypothetical protein